MAEEKREGWRGWRKGGATGAKKQKSACRGRVCFFYIVRRVKLIERGDFPFTRVRIITSLGPDAWLWCRRFGFGRCALDWYVFVRSWIGRAMAVDCAYQNADKVCAIVKAAIDTHGNLNLWIIYYGLKFW